MHPACLQGDSTGETHTHTHTPLPLLEDNSHDQEKDQYN